MMKHFSFLISLFIFCLMFFPSGKALSYADLQTKTLDNGIDLWVLEDKSVPVISVDFSFKGGIAQDPEDKLGRTDFLAAMLTQGAGDYNSSAFQKKLSDLSISLGFNNGRDYFYGSLKTLRKNQDEAWELLRLSLSEPRFEKEDMARLRTKLIASLKQNKASPSWQLWRNFNDTYYGDYPYGKPSAGTIETLEAITADDLRAFMRDYFAKDGLTIAFAGDISLNEAEEIVLDVFGRLSDETVYTPLEPFEAENFAREIHIPMDIAQNFILMGRPMPFDEDHPDWAAAQIANYLIGGGSFSSLLMEDIRSEKGLTYGISSSLLTQKYADLFVIQTSTAAKNLGVMKSAILESLNKVVSDNFKDDQIEKAKAYLIGSLPLSLTSTDDLSNAYLALQNKGLAPDYFEKRETALREVSTDDVRRITAQLLSDFSFQTVIVGPKAQENESEESESSVE